MGNRCIPFEFKQTIQASLSYSNLSDDKLVDLAQHDNEEAYKFLINKYQYLVNYKARSYFLSGADWEDTQQEGLIGLYKAIRDYNKNKFCTFRSFATLCITRQIITAVKTNSRKKHIPLNSYISLNNFQNDEDADYHLQKILRGKQVIDPLENMIIKERLNQAKEFFKNSLSILEQKVLAGYIEGKSYKEIAEEINIQTKVVDNALYRVKLKLSKLNNN